MVKHYKITDRGHRHILRENRQEKKINKSLLVANNVFSKRCDLLLNSNNFPYEMYYSLHDDYIKLCDKYCSLSKEHSDLVSGLNTSVEVSSAV